MYSILNLKPEIRYLQGETMVPSKSLVFKKINPKTGKPIMERKTGVKKFEKELKKELQNELKGVSIFPTDKEVFLIIEHGFSDKKEYDRRDLDNKSKCVLDALKGVVYNEDSQVKILWTHKELSDNSTDYFSISIKILDSTLDKLLIDDIRRFVS